MAIDKDKILGVMKNEHLIENEFSVIADSLWSNQGGKLYYGTGLCNSHCLTIGVPFDVLAMVLVAEKMRRALGFSGVIHHIADTHALCNFPTDNEGVAIKAVEFEMVMKKVVARLELSHFSIVRSSSFDASLEYSVFMQRVNRFENGEYARRELADMLWYQKNHNVALKLGWAAKGFECDERWYDNDFISRFGQALSFVYTKPGRALSSSNIRAVPYVATTEEDRIFLRAGEQVQAKLDNAAKKTKREIVQGVINHLGAICRLYEGLKIGPLDKGSVPKKVQQIINHIFE